jgi:hypothetical protein
MRASLVSVLLLSATLVACGDERAASPDALTLPGTPIPLEYVIPSGDPSGVERFSGFLDPARIVVREDAAWEDAWAMLVGDHPSPAPPRPAIDFDAEMVVVVSIGVTGGNRTMRVPLATRLWDGSLAVAVEEERLGRSCAFGPTETRPAVALRVPRSDSPVFFGEFLTIRECE